MGMKRRKKAWKQLDTHVVIGTSEATAVAVGGEDGEIIGLVDPTDVPYFNFKNIDDAWASTNGRTYLCAWRKDPLFCTEDGKWKLVDTNVPSSLGHDRITRVVGFSGPSPETDELYCLADPYTANPVKQCTLLWRRGGTWREVAVPVGRPWELAAGNHGEVYLSVGREQPSLVSVRDGEVTEIQPPAAAKDHRAVGVCAIGDDLLVCYSAVGSETAVPWLLRAGDWQQLSRDAPLKGWASGYIDSVVWQGACYLATDGGLFRLGADDRVILEYAFVARRLWPIGDALVCNGFAHGTYAHAINRGAGWEPLFIPDPDVVFGGFGKWVWLPPKRKVAHRRVRMLRPKPSAAVAEAPTVDAYCERWLKQRVFDGRSDARPAALQVASDLSEHIGTALSPQLGRYLDLYSQFEPSQRFGELGIWGPDYFAPPAREPTPELLAEAVFYQQPTTIAALTGTIYIGADHGGQVYFVEAAPESSEVFIYDPGQGSLSFLADSLDSFMFLNDLAEQWTAHARAIDVDFEDVEGGDVDLTVPEIRAITAGLRSLDTRVNLDEDAEVSSEFHELLPELTKVRPVSQPKSVVPRLFERARWLIMALGEIYLELDEALGYDFEKDMADSALNGLPASKVYWLWHLYLFDDVRLSDFAKTLRADSSSLVRGTAQLMNELTAPQVADRYAKLVGVREQVRAARAQRVS